MFGNSGEETEGRFRVGKGIPGVGRKEQEVGLKSSSINIAKHVSVFD